MGTLLTDAWVVTMNPKRDVLDQASVLVEGDRIAAVGTRAALERVDPGAEVIDCRRSIIIPGMVNTHTHLFQTLLKGLGDDMVLKKWFTCMTGPSAVALTVEDVSAAAMHGCVESIRSGVTSLVDFMYAHPRPGLTAPVIEAFEATGMRGRVCRGFLTAGAELGIPAALIEVPDAALADARALMRAHNRPDGRVQVGLAPAMIWSLDAAALRGARALADVERAFITTHVAETDFEISESQSRFGCTDTEFLGEIGFLGSDVLAVHCVQCGARDIRVLKHHDVRVSHNPCSNMYLASGVPPIPAMLLAGITVGLGSDGPASSNNHSLFQAMKFAALIQKGFHRDATVMTAEKVLEMATIDGARAIGMEHLIGSIEPGKKADLAVIDTSHPAMAPVHNPVSAIVYSALGHEVTHVLIDGRTVMRDGRITTVDEHAVLARSAAAAASLTRRAGTDGFCARPWRSMGF
ncbi:MAG TPA: amidohydrolase [Acetobacteraceae bacterium]|nr:amidohydrolase [Acetobacteraceae bacterium]